MKNAVLLSFSNVSSVASQLTESAHGNVASAVMITFPMILLIAPSGYKAMGLLGSPECHCRSYRKKIGFIGREDG